MKTLKGMPSQHPIHDGGTALLEIAKGNILILKMDALVNPVMIASPMIEPE